MLNFAIMAVIIIMSFFIFYATTVTEGKKTKMLRARQICDAENVKFIMGGIVFQKTGAETKGNFIEATPDEGKTVMTVDPYYATHIIEDEEASSS